MVVVVGVLGVVGGDEVAGVDAAVARELLATDRGRAMVGV
jgi:hypothetical protein